MIRAFLAIELKDKETIENIVSFSSRIKQNQPKVKLVEPKNLHITMKFFGNIPETLAPQIYAIIQKEINGKFLNKQSVEYNLTGVGQFNRYTVLWIKMRGDIDFIQSIKNEIEEQLYIRLNVEKDKRTQFKPHLTIGRLRKDRINYKNLNALKNLFNENKGTFFGPFTAKEVKLKRSNLTPKGPIYTNLVY